VIRWWRSHSVRVRLTLWYIATMIVVLGVYAGAVYTSVRQTSSQTLDQLIRRDFQWAAATVYQLPDGTFTWDEPEEIVAEADLPWVQVWTPDGQRMLFSNSEAQRNPIGESQALAAQAGNRIAQVQIEDTTYRILSRRGSIGPLDPASGQRPTPVVIQVGRSETPMREELGQLAAILAIGVPLAVAIAGLAGYTLARRALLPVERMTERARSITAERLSDRLPVHNPDDEIGQLATVFNETLSRLQLSFEQMRRFTSDVSHEVRTPLTAIRSVGEVGLREHRDDASYRAIIGSMLEEADRLASLVDRLLTLSRAETGQAKLSIEDVDLHGLAEDVAAHLGVLAEEKRQTISIERFGAPRAAADRMVMRQALINLVDNAIKFSPLGGRVRIRVAETDAAGIIEVIDSGSGINAEARPHIFDRFYRAGDSADAEPGTGLGLSIAKWAVEANGGRLTLEHSDTEGSTFRIALPRRAPAMRHRPAV
jgi:heavy metal sensor kinase